MSEAEIKLEILKLVHRISATPENNIEYARAYFQYITENSSSTDAKDKKELMSKKNK